MSQPSESYLVGLIGSGVTESLSPPMHEREADQLGLRYLYRPIDLTLIGKPPGAVGELLFAGRDLGFSAFNITHPAKQLAMEYLDEISDDAAHLGAVNTVLVRDRRLIGYNTDHSGFGWGLTAGLPDVPLGDVVQLGAGGAGAAVAYALLAAGVKTLRLSDVDDERAQQRATALRTFFPDRNIEAVTADQLDVALATADGLVNTTPVGMHMFPGLPLDGDLVHERLWVADVIYRPVETELMILAASRGCRVLDGGNMAVGQAVGAFELITGIAPSVTRMRKHFLDLLAAGR